MILVIAIGFGAMPGVLALGLHTMGFLAKFYAEYIDHINKVTIISIILPKDNVNTVAVEFKIDSVYFDGQVAFLRNPETTEKTRNDKSFKRRLNFVPSSRPDPIGDQNDVRSSPVY